MATNGLSRAETRTVSFEHRAQRAEESRAWCLKLLSALLHEMSQPLTVLAGEIQLLLLDQHPETEYREVLQQCAAQTDRLSLLLALLRELAEAERLPEFAEGVSVKEALRESVELLRPLAESKGVKLSLDVSSDKEVTGDAERLRKVLFQTLKSAVDRSPEGGQVRVVLLSSPHNAICRVTDMGSMPDAEAVARLLDPLRTAGRLPLLDSRLEWCLAKRMAEACGGSFTVDGNAQHCRVSITLPLCTPDSRRAG